METALVFLIVLIGTPTAYAMFKAWEKAQARQRFQNAKAHLDMMTPRYRPEWKTWEGR